MNVGPSPVPLLPPTGGYPGIPIRESMSLGRLAEVVTSVRPVRWVDANFLASSVGIPQPLLPSIFAQLRDKRNLTKSELLQFLQHAYATAGDRFPHLLEELLRISLSRFVVRRRRGIGPRAPIEVQKWPAPEFDRVWRCVQACLGVLGLGANVKGDPDSPIPIQIDVRREEGVGAEREEKNRLHNVLERDFPDEYGKLLGAYARYTGGGPDANRQTVEACRSAYEFFFRKLTGVNGGPWNSKLEEAFPSSTFRTYVKETFSFLSGAGTHSPADRERAEAALAIRATEHVMVAALMWTGRWGQVS